jgi:hypothetical protein
MIQLDTQTKLYILGAVIALTQLPKAAPYIKSAISWLHSKHVSFNYSTIFNSNTLVLAAVAFMLFTPGTSVTPTPVPPVPVVQKDKLDEANDVYRTLLSETWTEFATKRASFKTPEDALKWINDRQVAVYKSAHNPINTIAAQAAGGTSDDANKFATDLKNRSL